MAREQAEGERRAWKKAEAERIAREEADAERIERERAEAARKAASEQIEPQRTGVTHTAAGQSAPVAAEKAEAEPGQTHLATQESVEAPRKKAFDERRAILIASGASLLLLISVIWIWRLHSSPATDIPVALAPASGAAETSAASGELSSGKLAAYKFARALPGNGGEIFAVAFDPKSQIVAAGGAGKILNIFNASTGELLHTLDHEDVEALAFSHDGSLLASGGSDTALHIWRVASGNTSRSSVGAMRSRASRAILPLT
jgi:hypothetical protein